MPENLIRDRDTQGRLAFVWKNRQKAVNNQPQDAANELVGFLRQNGVAVLPDMILAINDACDDQWCTSEPSRCPGWPENHQDETPTSTVQVMELPKSSMAFAFRYWELVNTMLATDWLNPAEEVDRLADVGLSLCQSSAGCKECASHWDALLGAYPPLTLVTDNPSARVWFWRAHNHSREGKPPTPYADIEKGWRWPKISGQQVQAILERMGMAGTLF